MRVAVSGARGRLGRALIEALEEAPFTGPFGPIAWTRADLDLDRPETIAGILERDRPEVVVHAAAWTDVDGCARDPELAERRNGAAVGTIAAACAARDVDLIVISTNEVFDGRRTDARGYAAGDEPAPANAYGASKLSGEQAARAAFEAVGGPPVRPYRPVDRLAGGPQLAVVRTAWLYGPPGGDFPDKIIAAAEQALADGRPLRVTGDEVGDPTRAGDLAEAIVELLGAPSFAGLHHCVNGGSASRATWARAILAALGPVVDIEEVPLATWVRPSTPPRWGVLEPTPLPSGEPMRPWPEAMADDVAWRARARVAR